MEFSFSSASDKTEQYHICLEQFYSFTRQESNFLANAANLCALIQTVFCHHWVGLYFTYTDQLVLGPFQGPVACTRIAKGTGVCGKAWEQDQTILVGNVHEFPGHIACSSFSNSEIVVPLRYCEKVIGVLDIDSVHYDQFDLNDRQHLEQLCQTLVHQSDTSSFIQYLTHQELIR